MAGADWWAWNEPDTWQSSIGKELVTLTEKGSNRGPLVHVNGCWLGEGALLGPCGSAAGLRRGARHSRRFGVRRMRPGGTWCAQDSCLVHVGGGAVEGWYALGCVALTRPLMCPLIGPCLSVGPTITGWGGFLSWFLLAFSLIFVFFWYFCQISSIFNLAK